MQPFNYVICLHLSLKYEIFSDSIDWNTQWVSAENKPNIWRSASINSDFCGHYPCTEEHYQKVLQETSAKYVRYIEAESTSWTIFRL